MRVQLVEISLANSGKNITLKELATLIAECYLKEVCDRFGYDVSAKILADEGVPFHFVSKYFGGIDGLRKVVNDPGGIIDPGH